MIIVTILCFKIGITWHYLILRITEIKIFDSWRKWVSTIIIVPHFLTARNTCFETVYIGALEHEILCKIELKI